MHYAKDDYRYPWVVFAAIQQRTLNTGASDTHRFTVELYQDMAFTGMMITAPDGMQWLGCVEEWDDDMAAAGLRIALWPAAADQAHFEAKFCDPTTGRPLGLEGSDTIEYGAMFYTTRQPGISSLADLPPATLHSIAGSVQTALATTGAEVRAAFTAIEADYVHALRRDYLRSNRDMDNLHCWCGNKTGAEGFYPSTDQGHGRCGPGAGPATDWDGIHVTCTRCGAVVRCSPTDRVQVYEDDHRATHRYLLPVVAKTPTAGYPRAW